MNCNGGSTSKALLALTFLFLLSCGQVRAQEVQRLTFDDAVRIALEQNILLQKNINAVEFDEINVSRERMSFLPNFGFSTSGSQNYGRNFVLDEGRILNTTTEFVSVGVGSDVNIFNGFGDVSSLKRSQINLESSEYGLDRARQNVVFTVMSNYLTLIERREQIGVQEQNLEAQQKQLERIEAFTEVGSRPISDLYQQQAAVASAELMLLNAQRAYQLAESNLIQTLQLNPFGTYDFVAPEVEDVDEAYIQYNPGDLLRNAFEHRADLRAAELDIDAAEEGIRVARSTYWPSLSLRANYGSNYTTASEFGFWDQFDQRRGGSLGFSFSLPIFDRFTTRNNINVAQVQLENAELDLADLRQDVAVQVRQAYLDYVSADKRLDVTAKQLRSAELALEAARERYNVAAATLVEVSQATATYVEAATARVQAQYDFLFQQKLIDYYLGMLDPSAPLFD